MAYRLTKTNYLNYLTCPNEFWLDHHHPASSVDENSLEYVHLRQQGYEVQSMVKKLRRFDPDANKTVDYERIFQNDRLYARSDITTTDRATDEIDIYEVKSSSSVKSEHLEDVAFQWMTAEELGFKVRSGFVVTLNGEYVRDGEIDPEQLFVIHDVTAEVKEMLPETAERAQAAIDHISATPVPSLLEVCEANKLACRFIAENFPDLPQYTIFDIVRLNREKRLELLRSGVIDIVDVPDDFPLSAKQRTQVNAAISGKISYNIDAIKKLADGWQYPLHFLDYETFSYAIPYWNGIRPFQQMCFQYSLHTIPEEGAEMVHTEYLSRNDDDPPRAMAEHLRNAIGDNFGTVFVWYEPFEKTRNTEMGAMFPEHAEFFEKLNANVFDLMKIFSERLFIHPDFKGKSSIKKVLPVLVPDLSYKTLGIGDGMTATIQWYRAAKWDTLTQDERDRIHDDLEKYCHLDTLAMVKIYEYLTALMK